MYTPHQFELENGLRVIVVERSLSPTFTASLTYGIGAYDDPSDLPGVAHFSEHLAFRGPNRGTVEELAKLGSYTNAWTNTDHTQFFSAGPVEHLGTALSFFGNVLAVHPATPDDFVKERQVFGHELKSSRRNGSRQGALDRYWRATLGDPHWHLRPRKRAAAIKSLTAERVESWRRAHLPISSARLAIVSALALDDLKIMLEKSLSQVSSPEHATPSFRAGRLRQHRRITFCFANYKYAWLYLTFVSGLADPFTYLTARILSDYLGAGPHSRLFRCLRSDHPLAYSVSSRELAYLKTTALSCRAVVERAAIRPAIGIMLSCVDEIRNHGIDEDWLIAAKDRIRNRQQMWMDFPKELASFLAYDSLRPDANSVICPAKFLAYLSQLTLDEFNDRALSLLSDDNFYSFVGGRLGPISRFRLRRQLRKRKLSRGSPTDNSR